MFCYEEALNRNLLPEKNPKKKSLMSPTIILDLWGRPLGKMLACKVRCESLHTGVISFTVWYFFRKATVNVGWNKRDSQCHAVISKLKTFGTQSSRIECIYEILNFGTAFCYLGFFYLKVH